MAVAKGSSGGRKGRSAQRATGSVVGRSSKTVPTPPRKRKLKLQLSSMALAFQGAQLKPNWRAYVRHVQEAADDGDKDMKKIMTTFNDLSPHDRLEVMPEQLCELADVQKGALYGAVARQLYNHSQAEAGMILAINHPRIVERAVKEAKTRRGVKDRENLLKAGGVIPIPKSSTPPIIIQNNPRTLNVSGTPAAILPSMEEDMSELGEVDDEVVALLPAATVTEVDREED